MGIRPQEHIVDTGYLSLEQLVKSKQEHNIDLIGPVKEASTWRSKTDGAYTLDKFIIDWTKKTIYCPQGKSSSTWGNYYKNVDGYITVVFSAKDCKKCEARGLCVGATSSKRRVNFPMEMQYTAKKNLIERLNTPEGKALYAQRAGVEGTISQGVRNHGMRRSRYMGIRKTHLQEIASASAINIYRLANWFNNKPLEKSRESAFYQLRPKAA